MSDNTGKKFWLSKTFWLNLLAIAAIIVQTQTGYVIGLETQAAILAILNLILRVITNTDINWK